MDWEKLGLTVGIEIHQELATRNKLFCSCPPKLSGGDPEYNFMRKLRPSQSELGEVDPAALFEFLKGKSIIYEADRETTCLVEMDEEPPGPLNPEAIDIAMTFTLMTEGKPVDEIQVMRKTVVDGSNTGGFQRTCVISLGGRITAGGRVFRLEQVCLEEDAARRMAEGEGTITYRLDRLGIPLIEITTAPDIHSPEEAYLAARRIGSILRGMGRVKRGLGTIRQDLNVSIRGGPVIEIKGVQDLGNISTVVEYEAMRQASLLDIEEKLRKRGVKTEEVMDEVEDVTEIFEDTRSGILRNAISRGGGVYAVKLPGFDGLLGYEICPDRRLGTEMADHARFGGGVKGIFHTDELPAYDISGVEVNRLRRRMGGKEIDAVVIVADERERCINALSAVVERARASLEGVPEETRSANPDGTTRFTRPRPGAARMYPETDVRAIMITDKRIEKLRRNLPPMPEERLRRFMEDYGLNEKLAKQVLESDHYDVFEKLASSGVSTTLAAVTLTEDFTKLRRDGIPVEELSDKQIEGTFELIQRGLTAKESIPEILEWLTRNPDMNPEEALKSLGKEMLSREELREIVDQAVTDNIDFVEKSGMKAMGRLMGVVMSRVRGRAKPREVQEMIKERLRSI